MQGALEKGKTHCTSGRLSTKRVGRSYQWLASGKPIVGAHTKTYAVRQSDGRHSRAISRRAEVKNSLYYVESLKLNGPLEV
jgi:hypothetical protein